MIDAKLREKARKQDEFGRSLKKVAEYESQISNKTNEMSRNIASFERLQEQARKKQASDSKRRADKQKKRDEEALKREREITKEREKQSRLHTQMRMSSFTIDVTKLPTKIKVLKALLMAFLNQFGLILGVTHCTSTL